MIISIEDPNDSRVAGFTGLSRDDAKRDRGDTFVAEGRVCVRLLAESEVSVESILVQSGREHEAAQWVSQNVPIYVVDSQTIRGITGFDFHRGFLALGHRPMMGALDQFVSDMKGPGSNLAVASVGVSERENLGVIMRTAAGLGISRFLVCPRSADPYSRRAVRTSMATVMKQTLYALPEPAKDFRCLADAGFRTVVTTLDDDAVPLDQWVTDRQFVTDRRPIVIAVGNEATGIPADVVAAATDRVTIPMSGGVDSLNAGVAAGIVMYQLSVGNPSPLPPQIANR